MVFAMRQNEVGSDQEPGAHQFLNSFQLSRGRLVLLLWNCGCLFWCHWHWGWLSVAGKELVYVAFWPLVPIVAMVWLWGLNVVHFDKSGIKYEVLFGTEGNPVLLKGFEILKVAGVITSWMVSNLTLCIGLLVIQRHNLALLVPCFLYISLLLLVVCPVNICYKDARIFFAKTLVRAICPIQNVTFADFILADILTSLAKAMAETQLALCLLVSGEAIPGLIESTLSDPIGTCGRGSWHVNFVLALPYICRLAQCIIVYWTVGDTNQLFNALKYSTAIPVIIFSYIQYHTGDGASFEMWWTLWLLASTVNTLYSFYWDIEMDWDISWFSQGQGNHGCGRFPVLKSDLLYPKIFYFWAILSNLFIRVLWIYKLSSHLRFSKGISFLVSFLEVIRRHQWVFIRVECGLRKSHKVEKLQPARASL